MVNPVKPTAESQAKAKKMYGYDCAMCHGATGDGKGDLVADMKLTLKDLTDPAALTGMSDGEIFALLKNGKGEMSGEGDRAKPEDIWNLVIYVRSLAGKPRASVGGPQTKQAAEGELSTAIEESQGLDPLPGLRGPGAEGKASGVPALQVVIRARTEDEGLRNPFLWEWHFSNGMK
jgi:mono/diheme cytochrome c family protein